MDQQGPTGSHHFGRRINDLSSPVEEPPATAREPFSRAPWPALVLAVSILMAFALQTALGSVDGWNERWGFRPDAAASPKDALTLITAMWSHANWTHAGVNAAFALAFGAPVSRMCGVTVKGAALFLVFYLAGGVLASLGFAALHQHDDVVMVGASGAISALTGAATRLLGRAVGGGASADSPLASLTSAPVLVMTFAFVTANVILGLFVIDLGQGDAPLAWETHVAGYLAGLLLIGPFAKFVLRRGVATPAR